MRKQKKYFSLFKYMDSSISYFMALYDGDQKLIDAELVEMNLATEKLFGIRQDEVIGLGQGGVAGHGRGELRGIKGVAHGDGQGALDGLGGVGRAGRPSPGQALPDATPPGIADGLAGVEARPADG